MSLVDTARPSPQPARARAQHTRVKFRLSVSHTGELRLSHTLDTSPAPASGHPVSDSTYTYVELEWSLWTVRAFFRFYCVLYVPAQCRRRGGVCENARKS